MGRVAPFDGRLTRVTSADTLKVGAARETPPERAVFTRRPDGPGIAALEDLLPRGPTFFHDAFRLQLLEELSLLAEPRDGRPPPWVGKLTFEFRPADNELQTGGSIECLIPDEPARLALADHCRAMAAMLVAYAQLPGTPSFNLALEYWGTWVARE